MTAFRNKNTPLGPNHVTEADSSHISGGGRKRVVNRKTLFSAKFEYTELSHFFDEKSVGGGVSTHLYDESSVLMTVPAPGDELIRQSKIWSQYQPFNTQEIVNSWVFGDHQPGIVKEVGYNDGLDGPLFRQKDGQYWLVLFSSVPGVDPVEVPQSEWNIDRFSGGNKDENPSGVIFDFSKALIQHIDLVWLGVDRVRFDFVIDGIVYQSHEVFNAGKYSSPYMRTASLPIRVRIKNESSVTPGTMKQICSYVGSEGGEEIFGIRQVAGVYNLPVAAAAFLPADGAGIVKPDYESFTPLLVIRPRATYYTHPNRGQVREVGFSITVKGNVPVFWALLHDPAFENPLSFSPIALEGERQPSITEYASGTVAANKITDPGHVHRAGVAVSSVKGETLAEKEIVTNLILTRYTFDHTDDANSDVLCLAIAGDGAVVTDVTPFIEVAEIF